MAAVAVETKLAVCSSKASPVYDCTAKPPASLPAPGQVEQPIFLLLPGPSWAEQHYDYYVTSHDYKAFKQTWQ